MNRYFTLAVRCGLALLLLGSAFAGCRGEEEPRLQPSRYERAATDEADPCVGFRGNRHCPIGNAALVEEGDQALVAKELNKAEEDGVAIFLPEVTEFIPTGQFENPGRPSTMVARSINEGVSTSTMTSTSSDAGLSLSASFTGTGAQSTYSAIFYRQGQEVGRIPGIRNGGVVDVFWPPWHFCEPWPWCLWWPPQPPHFRVLQRGPELGACSWSASLGDRVAMATLENGETVETDAIELQEEVEPAKSAYPYLTFNRIDYMYDGGGLILTDEKVR